MYDVIPSTKCTCQCADSFIEFMSSVTERRGTIGTVKGSGDNEVFQPKANFCLKIVAKVEGTKDGYVARVTRAPDNVTR